MMLAAKEFKIKPASGFANASSAGLCSKHTRAPPPWFAKMLDLSKSPGLVEIGSILANIMQTLARVAQSWAKIG